MAPRVPAGKHPRLVMFWKILSISFGGALILLGIVGLFLPILQGWLMIFAGLAILSPHSRWARRTMNWLKAKLRIRRRHPEGAVGDDRLEGALRDDRDRKVGS